MNIVQYGLYNILDQYFVDFKSEFLPDNKKENRPYYCAFEDKQGIFWFIPMSSQCKNYRLKIENDKALHGKCLFYHIGKIMNSESVFLIGNMFPTIDKYIKKPFTFSGIQYVVQDKNLIFELHSRASRYLALVGAGKLRPNVDILDIKNKLSK
jgi:hypothetical protein